MADETLREVSLQRIVAQRLAGPRFEDPADAVAHMGAMQGQDLRAAAAAVALRCVPGAPSLPHALEAGTVVRSWPMRGTLHLITPAHLPGVLALTAERQLRSDTRRREALGITEAVVDRAAALALSRIDDDGPASRSELTTAWAPLGVDQPGMAYHLLYTLCLRGVLVQGPPHPSRASEQLFVRYGSRVPPSGMGGANVAGDGEGLAWWAGVYARSHGPVTEGDLARWTALPKVACRRALEAAASGGAIEEVEIGGVRHWRDPAVPGLLEEYRAEAEAELLTPAFDELILGYADRTATLAAEHEAAVVPGRNGVFRPVAVRGGRAYGTWARGKSGVEVTRFA